MPGKRVFAPGEWVATFRGEPGRILGPEGYRAAVQCLREGKRPGRYFAPGCCADPDYISRIPVVFPDGTYDVLRSLNLRRGAQPDPAQKQEVLDILSRIGALRGDEDPVEEEEV